MSPLELEPQLKRIQKLSLRHGGLSKFLAIFDLGSRASRLLVGPISAAHLLDKHFITSISNETFLGQSKSATLLEIAQDHRLEYVCTFLKEMTDCLLNLGLPKANIRVIGTAVFRKIANEALILKHVEEHTGLRIEIIDELYEARLGMLSVWMNFKSHKALRDGDYLVLVDQGGGSTEVAFTKFNKKEPPSKEAIHAHSFGIGTIELENRTAVVNAGIRPAEVGVERIRLLTEDSMKALPSVLNGLSGKKIHAFGTGSAITKMARGTVWQLNGRVISYSALRRRIERLAQINSMQAPNNVTADLTQLFGLPAYTKVLDELRLGKITICGFGLRFGALYENVLGLNLQ